MVLIVIYKFKVEKFPHFAHVDQASIYFIITKELTQLDNLAVTIQFAKYSARGT